MPKDHPLLPLPALQSSSQTNTANTVLARRVTEEPPAFGLQTSLVIKRNLNQKLTTSSLIKPNSQAQLSQKQPASKQGAFNKITLSGQEPAEDGGVGKKFPASLNLHRAADTQDSQRSPIPGLQPGRRCHFHLLNL